MNKILPQERLEKVIALLWGLVLITLPVTSFRYYPKVFGRTTVQPLALFPLALLLPALLLLYWRQRKLRLPQAVTPLAALLLFALAATILGGLIAPLDFRGSSLWDRALRAWFSFGIGLAFFLAAFLVSRKIEILKPSLKWLFAGFLLTILWGLVQAVAINTPFLTRDLIEELQTTFSLRPTMNRRVSGFAFEPAWLADQIMLLWFPWLFAAIFTNYRPFKKNWLAPSLIIAGFVLILLTYSRSGLLNAILTTGVVFLAAGRHLWGRVWDWFSVPLRSGSGRERLLRLGMVALVMIAAFAALFWLGQYQYFANLWQTSLDEGLVNYIIRNNAGSRLANNVAGLNIFAGHPWFGVGLGGSSLYLADAYPDWSLSGLPELARMLSPDSNTIPNIKNLYIRMLAETGLIGFWLFLAFFLSMLGTIWRLLRAEEPQLKYIGTAGLFIWLAAMIRNLTQDSLTFPVMWVGLGIVIGYANSLLGKRD
jgi:hypothetical protein